ncbi:LuxR family transcriptional regulator, partial [Parabacteroides distasonis]
MKISTKAASFLSSIKTQTYDKKEREMIITYQQKRVFHLSLLMLV